MGWKMATQGLFRAAKVLCQLWLTEVRDHHSHIGNSCYERQQNSALSSAAMGGRRMLCQTLNNEFAQKGIHVAHVVIDGAVDAPDTLGKMLGDKLFKELRETSGKNDGLVLPEKVAEAYYYLYAQHRSTWTHELDLRSYSDAPWWNHS